MRCVLERVSQALRCVVCCGEGAGLADLSWWGRAKVEGQCGHGSGAESEVGAAMAGERESGRLKGSGCVVGSKSSGPEGLGSSSRGSIVSGCGWVGFGWVVFGWVETSAAGLFAM